MFVGLMAVLFIAGGIVAFKTLPIEAFPDVSDIQVNVIALYPGRAAEEVEKQVTLPVEVALSGLPMQKLSKMANFAGLAPTAMSWRTHSSTQARPMA